MRVREMRVELMEVRTRLLGHATNPPIAIVQEFLGT